MRVEDFIRIAEHEHMGFHKKMKEPVVNRNCDEEYEIFRTNTEEMDILKSIVASGEEVPVLRHIDNLISGKCTLQTGANSVAGCNTYPFGRRTDKVYPLFVAISRGGTAGKFRDALDYTLIQSAKMAQQFGGSEFKSVIFITDAWLPNVFKKYEEYFLIYSLRDGIRFRFFLATDHGCTQVPVRSDLMWTAIDSKDVDWEPLFEDQIVDSDGLITYTEMGPHMGMKYRFYFYDRKWECLDLSDGKRYFGKLDMSLMREFYEKNKWIMDAEETDMDMPGESSHNLTMFGEEFSWVMPQAPGNSDERITELMKMLKSITDKYRKKIK